MYDDQFRKEFKQSRNSIVGWLLMCSWLYYHKPCMSPIVSDEVFDKACKWLHENYDEITHRYKHLVNKDDLKAGSLYSLGSYDYPKALIHIAELISEDRMDFLEG